MTTPRRAASLALVSCIAATGALASVGTPQAHADTAAKMQIVLDASGSMAEPAGDGQSKIQAARSALTTMIDGMPAGAQVGMRVYGATAAPGKDTAAACSDSQQVVPVGTLDKAAMKQAVNKYAPKGQTPTAYALSQAAKDLGTSGQRSIVLVSDGEATCSPDPCVTAKELAKQGVDLRVDVIGFKVSSKARKQLSCVSSATGGKYYSASDTSGLTSALKSTKDRALQPFSVSGKKVTGTATSTGAPELAAGRYTDAVAAEGKAAKFYSLKHSMTGSSFQVGVTTRPTSERSQLKLEIKTVDGTSCGYDSPSVFNTSYSQQLLSGVVSTASREYSADECATKDLVLSVSQTDWSQADAGTPMQIDVMELPKATNAADLPQAADDATWASMPAAGTARRVSGGTSLATATTVNPGTVGFDLVPGEVRFFKVPATWGQQVQAQATAEANPAYDGPGWQNLTIMLLSPTGGDADDNSPDNMPTSGGSSLRESASVNGDGASVAATTVPIRLNNRGSYGTKVATSAPGDYYIAVGLGKNSSENNQVTSPLAVKLQVATTGTAGSGAPTFADNASVKTVSGTMLDSDGSQSSTSPSAGASGSSSPSPSSSSGSAAQQSGASQASAVAAGQPDSVSSDGGTNWLLIGAGGGTALLAALGVLAAVLLRRS